MVFLARFEGRSDKFESACVGNHRLLWDHCVERTRSSSHSDARRLGLFIYSLMCDMQDVNIMVNSCRLSREGNWARVLSFPCLCVRGRRDIKAVFVFNLTQKAQQIYSSQEYLPSFACTSVPIITQSK